MQRKRVSGMPPNLLERYDELGPARPVSKATQRWFAAGPNTMVRGPSIGGKVGTIGPPAQR